ncbi:hypothetical protein [Actinokineospora terrae]|uniref:Uncharacterized protein n=1 Tax=Actinokineospora terrae TaxID=155974 RepID=A0A1H9TGZ1_9PSEU|nr:hypothetical protein [Actinokineospora terrae]SER96485.1 hypothetical protein SAMN04487818_106281 [Actinokineospora terrae]
MSTFEVEDSTGVCQCPTYSAIPGRRELHDVGAPGCAYETEEAEQD